MSFFAGLTKKQQGKALAYRGEENHGCVECMGCGVNSDHKPCSCLAGEAWEKQVTAPDASDTPT